MQIIDKNIKDLIPYEKNPRNNKEAVEYVAQSIKEFGFKVPIIIDSNNVIVAGHTRLIAAKKLKMKTVPCIVADDLSREQIKAFRLADNKVAEFSQWDFDLLDEELEDIFDIDMSEFGFDMPEEKEEPEEKEPNERARTNSAYNLDLIDLQNCEGFYQIPIIKCDNYIPKKIKSFNYALSSNDKDFGIHFYIDDYQFERLWNSPEAYIDTLLEYDCIFSPDFSLYKEMPRAMKLWNIYRSRMLGNFYQGCGCKVIPTISWCEPETFEFCFDGIPERSIVSVSTIGIKQDPKAYEIWKDGMDAMIEKINPKAIIVYGGKVEYDYGNIKAIYFDNENTERMKTNESK